MTRYYLTTFFLVFGWNQIAISKGAADAPSLTNYDLKSWTLSAQDIPAKKSKVTSNLSAILKVSGIRVREQITEDIHEWQKGRPLDLAVTKNCETYFPLTYKAMESKIRKEEFKDTDNLRQEVASVVKNKNANKVYRSCLERLSDRSKFYADLYNNNENQVPFFAKTFMHLQVEISAQMEPTSSSGPARAERSTRIGTMINYWESKPSTAVATKPAETASSAALK